MEIIALIVIVIGGWWLFRANSNKNIESKAPAVAETKKEVESQPVVEAVNVESAPAAKTPKKKAAPKTAAKKTAAKKTAKAKSK